MKVSEYAKKNKRDAADVLKAADDLGINAKEPASPLSDADVKALDAHLAAQGDDKTPADEKDDAKAKATTSKALKQRHAELLAEMRAAGVAVPGEPEATGDKSFLVTPKTGPKATTPPARVIENVCDEGEAKRVFFADAGIVDTHFYSVDVTPA